MGPILILDKSAFQALSGDEFTYLDRHFSINIPPILILEILGDLASERYDDDRVAHLAERLLGWSYHNEDHRHLCLASLLGARFDLSGSVAPFNAVPVEDPEGGRGLYVDQTAPSQMLIRWSSGGFDPDERQAAAAWRDATLSIDPEYFRDSLNERQIVIPAASSVEEIPEVVTQVLNQRTLQSDLLVWLVQMLRFDDEPATLIRARWRLSRYQYLERFAPYAHYCLRVLLSFVAGLRRRLLTERLTDRVDLDYLFYLPFCMAFVSNDRFHRALAPLLATNSWGEFVHGNELKQDLQRIVDFWEARNERERELLRYVARWFPPVAPDSIVCSLWRRSHMRSWDPETISRPEDVGDEDWQEALRLGGRWFAQR